MYAATASSTRSSASRSPAAERASRASFQACCAYAWRPRSISSSVWTALGSPPPRTGMAALYPASSPATDFPRNRTAIAVVSSGQFDRKGVPVRKLVFGFMVAVALLAFPAVAGAKVGGGGTILRHGPITKLRHSTSTNWAGYAATGGGFTTVTSTWTQPTATCTSATTYSSFWVGLDGDGSNTLEQTGTEADCSGGHASYSAWYEMYPKYPAYVNIAVHPGNSFTATVTASGSRYTLTLKNNSTGAVFTTSQRGRGANYSA